jgi:hypothetical protein
VCWLRTAGGKKHCDKKPLRLIKLMLTLAWLGESQL